MKSRKRLLVLGAGRGQVDLIKTAKEMGHSVVVTTLSDDYPGVKEADEVCYVDMSDPKEVLNKSKELNIDGIVTACNDIGISSVGYVCDVLGLKGLTKAAADRCNNKFLMKEVLINKNVPTAKFVKVNNILDLKDTIKSLGYPIVVKAVDLQGSRGVYICYNDAETYSAFENCMSQTKQDFCIVEEFIDGYEFGAEAFVFNGEIIFVLPHGRNVYMSSTTVPIGHYAPFEAEESIIQQTEKIVYDSIKAMEIDNCALNFDLMEKEGKVYVIELTGRAGANCLPELVSLYYGINYYEMIVSAALNEKPKEIFEKRNSISVANASRMLLSEKSGVIKEIIDKNDINDPEIKQIRFFVNKGDLVRKFTNSNDCIAQVIVVGKNYDECNMKIEGIKQNIEVII